MKVPQVQSRFALATFCLIISVGASALFGVTYIATPNQAQSQTESLQSQSRGGAGLSDGTGVYFFGNKITTPTGWEMPANTLISTSFVTTQSMDGLLLMTIYTIPYALGQNTHLQLGLYINGVLKSNNTVDVSGSPALVASMVGQALDTSTGLIANFTRNSQAYQAAIGPLTSPLLAGTTVTLTAFSSSAIWVKTTQVASSPSYELTSPTALPGTLPSTLAAVVVPSLCIQGEANAA